jgi:hypothetical protein
MRLGTRAGRALALGVFVSLGAPAVTVPPVAAAVPKAAAKKPPAKKKAAPKKAPKKKVVGLDLPPLPPGRTCYRAATEVPEPQVLKTVRAQADCYVMEIDKTVMGEVIRDAPECLRQLSEILATRRLETEGIVKEAVLPADKAAKEREYRATFLARLRTIFAL